MNNNFIKLINSILIAIFIGIFSFVLKSQELTTDLYFLKFRNDSSQEKNVESLSQISDILVLELDETLTEDGFQLIRLPNANLKSAIVNQLLANEDVMYLSPVYVLSEDKVISHTNEIYVAFKGFLNTALIDYFEEKFDLTNDKSFNSLPYVYKFLLKKSDVLEIKDICMKISLENSVRYCQPNYMFSIDVHSNDPYFPRQWALKNDGVPLQYNGTAGADMKVVEAWEITRGNSNIRMAVLDSGVDTLHPDLIDNILPGFDAIGEGTNGFPSTDYDSDAHGTACAGILGAVADNNIGIAGVAPECKIIPVRLFHYINFMGQIIPWSTSDWMVDGITWAWQVGKADILSNSWGITDQYLSMFPGQDSIVNEAIFLALANGRNGKGVPMLFSSGNDGDAPIWPSRLPQVIAVNASSMCDERKSPTSCDNENFWEGNWGEGLDITAPGVKIYTTDITGPFGFSNGAYTNNFNGTSSACPNAAGVMALILSVNPYLTQQQARYVLESTCDKVGGYNYSFNKPSGTWSNEMGYGRVNAKSAVLKAIQMIPPKIESSFFVYHYTDDGKHIIACNLENSAEVNLDVFNVFGNCIARYPSQQMEKGLNLFYLNNDLSQGLYFARVNINGASSVVKFFTLR
ncbi:MAG: S8 family serine peptidase [Bacteroidales bacterium]|nr:S8 family serine peptidase [Bacteroidales bacterium]